MSYIQGFVVPVPTDNKDAYVAMAAKAMPYFKELGALRMVECWGVDVPHGKQTDFHRAVQATADETVVFSWIEWPDRETCDTAAQKMQSDERMKPDGEMPFDGRRMFWGGFEPVFDSKG
jgi:uncharacterized protein YbaA (DUF1428 family)